jgi:5-formyltetrahydrofolate cyclo-ligase
MHDKKQFRRHHLTMTRNEMAMSKAELRIQMRDRLRATSADERAVWSVKIVERLMSDESWVSRGGVVALFGGIKTEPNILPLLPWLIQRGIKVAFFAINGDHLVPYLVNDETDFISGAMGVIEPKIDPALEVKIEELSAVLVSGLAFGREDGSRLGRGKGYYDRVLGHPNYQGISIGISFSIQQIPVVPREPHDACLEHLVSEAEWLKIG